MEASKFVKFELFRCLFSLPLTRSWAECETVAASLCTRQVYMPLWDRSTLVMLNALLKSSYCLIVIVDTAEAFSCPLRWSSPPPLPPTADEPPLVIATSSLSQVKDSGKSPVTTTHCMLVRSPTFKSRANVNGVIFGGTEIRRAGKRSTIKR